MKTRLLALALAVAGVSACGAHLTDPGTEIRGLPAGLEAELTVDPGVVFQGGSFDVTLTVTNRTVDTIRVTTAHSCLVIPHVLREGVRMPFEGSWYGCLAAITTHTFAPGETKTRQWEMRAVLYAEHPGNVDGRLAPSGVYTVRAEFDMVAPDGSKPSIERGLLVH